ncbi:MAG: paraquat-inducible membrane protein A [Helicobacteraceae bacterium]|nr:paraquat-inducible membrane protein A [Helicobacteraceae bacterium]
MKYRSDIDEKMTLCLSCHTLQFEQNSNCYVCDNEIHQRKPNSLKISFIFLISAFLFLIPANILIMMSSVEAGTLTSKTIFGGILFFFKAEDYFVGTLIFLASIVIPFFKIISLSFLLYVAKYKKQRYSHVGIKLYRIIDFIGKWSMLDIFVVAIMVGIVQFNNLALMIAGPASFAFATAVVLTILAVEHFDPRLLWSNDEQ